MAKWEIGCSTCSAEFTIEHNMNEDKYQIEKCPFCDDEFIDVEEIEEDE